MTDSPADARSQICHAAFSVVPAEAGTSQPMPVIPAEAGIQTRGADAHAQPAHTVTWRVRVRWHGACHAEGSRSIFRGAISPLLRERDRVGALRG